MSICISIYKWSLYHGPLFYDSTSVEHLEHGYMEVDINANESIIL